MRRIIIAGIDTEVGKTVVSALCIHALQGHYWKPIQCGLPSDQEWIASHCGERCYPSDLVFAQPCSPHLAARREGRSINPLSLQPPSHAGWLIIEGTGGILTPLNETHVWADMAARWEAQWVLVHRHYLGSLNHCLLTLEALHRRGIRLLGLVFNGEGDPATEEMLLRKAESRCLGRLAWQAPFTPLRIVEIAQLWKSSLMHALGA